MTTPHDDIARRAATRFAEGDARLLAEVERELVAAGTEEDGPPRRFDPATAIALGSLIVSIAGLAWTIYRDIRADHGKPSADALARRIRIELGAPKGPALPQQDRVISVVVEEVLAADQGE